MALYFITSSKHKFAEVKAMLPTVEQLEIELHEIQELDAHKIIKAKLTEALKHHKGPLIAEDTSLYIDGMYGLPGPFNKWFLQALGPEGVYNLTKLYGSAARAVTMLGYVDERSTVEFFEGETVGQLVAPRGETTFGWDAIFEPAGTGKTYAEMSKEEKNNISHRSKAIEKLKARLANELV